jgi:hypothetical protein
MVLIILVVTLLLGRYLTTGQVLPNVNLASLLPSSPTATATPTCGQLRQTEPIPLRVSPSLVGQMQKDRMPLDTVLTSLCETRRVQEHNGGQDHAITWLKVRLPDGGEGWANQAYLLPLRE